MAQEFSVLIQKNDLKLTFVEHIKAGLNEKQASKVASALNAMFASQGVKWFATTNPIED